MCQQKLFLRRNKEVKMRENLRNGNGSLLIFLTARKTINFWQRFKEKELKICFWWKCCFHWQLYLKLFNGQISFVLVGVGWLEARV